MSSGFSGGGPEFYTAGGITPGRSTIMPTNSPQIPYRSAFAGILPDPASQIVHRRPDLIGKRSLAEFQQQHQLLQLQQQQQQQQQHGFGLYFRNVKPRTYQHAAASPISPLSPMDFSTTSEVSSMNPRYGLPILPQLRPQPITANHSNNILPTANNNNHNNFNLSFSNLVQNHASMAMANQDLLSSSSSSSSCQESEKKIMNKLQELEKELLDDNDEEDQGEAVSVVTNSEWSETIQSLISPNHMSPISPSPTSSSSSCVSTSASPPVASPKQLITDAASAISEGKPEVASEMLTRLTQMSNVKGTSEQRLISYMASALRSRVYPTEYPPPVSELYSKEHTISTQMLYEVSPCFKLGFMAANLAILEATTSSDQVSINKLHVIDFDIGQGGQYVHLLHALAAKKAANKPITILKITTFTDFVNGGEEKLKVVGDGLKALANKVGLSLVFNVMSLKICDLSPEKLGLENDEALAVNFAFRLYKLPDESVTTENLRDELLRRVKRLSPKVVAVVEQEMNANTAPFVARVNEVCGYYGALFDSLDVTVSRESSERVRIEEGLSRKMANSVACEGRDRLERCEVFGKWRARLCMAGFEPKHMSQLVADSLRSKLSSGTRGNPGFTVNEQNGGICFGWMGRTLTVASAWR